MGALAITKDELMKASLSNSTFAKKTFHSLFFLGLISASGFSSAYGSEMLLHGRASHFKTLGKMFSSGKVPSLSKLSQNLWAGRCFEGNSSRVTNAAYLFRMDKTGNTLEASSIWDTSMPVDFYDSQTREELLEKKPKFRIASIQNGAIEFGLKKGLTSALRASGPYLVEEISELRMNEAGPIAGKPVKYVGTRCYYFIPEYEG